MYTYIYIYGCVCFDFPAQTDKIHTSMMSLTLAAKFRNVGQAHMNPWHTMVPRAPRALRCRSAGPCAMWHTLERKRDRSHQYLNGFMYISIGLTQCFHGLYASAQVEVEEAIYTYIYIYIYPPPRFLSGWSDQLCFTPLLNF